MDDRERFLVDALGAALEGVVAAVKLMGRGIIGFIIVALVALLANLLSPAHGQTHSFQDTNGREIGRSVTDQSGTTYYDAMGRNIRRSVTHGNTTTIYENMGRRTGSITTKPQGR
jgi:hypothetical protein